MLYQFYDCKENNLESLNSLILKNDEDENKVVDSLLDSRTMNNYHDKFMMKEAVPHHKTKRFITNSNFHSISILNTGGILTIIKVSKTILMTCQ